MEKEESTEETFPTKNKRRKRREKIIEERDEKGSLKTLSESVEIKLQKEKTKKKRSTKNSDSPSRAKESDENDEDEFKEFENIRSNKKKKKTKSSRRKRKKISSSTLSLENDFQPGILKDLQEDVHSDDNYCVNSDGVESSYNLRSLALTPSRPSGKVYVEKSHGFSNVSSKKISASQVAFATAAEEASRSASVSKVFSSSTTPSEWALEMQRIFRAISIFCHGLLAGMAFWQVLIVYIPRERGLEFVNTYSPLSQPLQVFFYFLTVICTVSVLDRYDVARMSLKQIQSMITFRSGGLAVFLYVFTLGLTLVTTKLDDKLSLHQYNTTVFENEESQAVEHEIETWKTMNLCRSVFVILGWVIISIKPDTDLLYKHLKELSDYLPQNKKSNKSDEII